MASAPASKPKYAAALVYHDWLNIFVLPLIFALSVAGLTGILNPVHVSEEVSFAPAPAALSQDRQLALLYFVLVWGPKDAPTCTEQ